MERIKKLLFSEDGMRIVNFLFVLSAFLVSRTVLRVAYVMWLIYIVYCIKHTTSKVFRVIYGILALCAGVMLLENFHFVQHLHIK